MSLIEKILIYQYLAPMFAVTIIVFQTEKKTKLYPCRDGEELAGRVSTSFFAIILFCFMQAVIRSY